MLFDKTPPPVGKEDAVVPVTDLDPDEHQDEHPDEAESQVDPHA